MLFPDKSDRRKDTAVKRVNAKEAINYIVGGSNSFRTFSNEARAVQKILSRSNIQTLSLARVCGLNVRTLHTSQSRSSDNEDQGK